MLIGGWRGAPQRGSDRSAGGHVPPASLFGSPSSWPMHDFVPLLIRSLIATAVALSCLVAPLPAVAETAGHRESVTPASTVVAAQTPRSVVAAPTSALPLQRGMSSSVPPPKTFASLISPMMVPADPVVTQPSNFTVSLTMTVDTRVHLTATASPSSYGWGGGYSVEIHDLAAPTSNSELGSCAYTNTPCAWTGTPSYATSRYVAIVTTTNSTSAFPSVVLAVSDILTPPAWTVSIAPTVTSTISITATTNYALDSPARYLQISDLSDGSGAGGGMWCSSGTVCVRSGFAPKNANSSYQANVTTYPTWGVPSTSCCLLATSSIFTPPGWTVSLQGSGTSLTATSNYDVGAAGRWFEIFDMATTGYIGWCSSGTSCTQTTTSTNRMFIATIGSISNNFAPNPLLAVSNQTGLQGPTAPYETAGGSNPAQMSDCLSCAGDPVNTSTGEFFETATDLSVPGRGPGLEQTRTYSSQRASQGGPLGFGWSSPYGMKAVELSAGGSVQVLQENGSQVTFTPTGSGTYTAPTRVLAALVHNADGTWTFTRKSREIFTFSAAGWLTKISDLNANAVTLTYDTAGKLASVSDSQARTLTFGYGTNGKMATATDPAGRTTSYAYDGAGRLASVTAPGGGVTQYGYDAGNLLTSTTDPRGYTTVNTYDLARRVTKQTTAAGDLLLSYGADSGDALTTITSPGGRVTKETYRAGQLIKRIAGAGTAQAATWTYAYDQSTFARSTVTDPLNRTTSATYDAHGNKLTATEAGGGHASATYGTYDNMLTSTDAAGTTTTFTYNSAGNRLTSSRPLTGTSQVAVVTNTYADTAHPGDITAVTDPNGNSTTITYDTYGNRTSVTDALGRTTARLRHPGPDNVHHHTQRKEHHLHLQHRWTPRHGHGPARKSLHVHL